MKWVNVFQNTPSRAFKFKLDKYSNNFYLTILISKMKLTLIEQFLKPLFFKNIAFQPATYESNFKGRMPLDLFSKIDLWT